MPNNFGGDQDDPEYAPHMYNEKGEFVGNPNSDNVRNKFEKELEAANERKVPHNAPSVIPIADLSIPKLPTDKRIRFVVGDYRAVIPNGAQKGRRFFTNNSPVVIEKRSRDATGAEKWDCVASIPKPAPKGVEGDVDYATNCALYWLLAGPDAE